MNRLSSAELVRLRELLADEILGQLDTADTAEFEALRAQADAEQLAELDQTFGELLVAIADGIVGTMPADAKQRLLSTRPAHSAPAPSPVAPIRTGMSPLGRLGWAAAIAAAITAAVVWINRPTPTPVQPEPSPIAKVTQDPGTVAIDIAPQGTLAEATQQTSEVLWNQDLQQGVLRLTGVPENDPTLEQYQLWIFDATRGEYAVDGGVFNISGATERDDQGRLLVPFSPKLTVGNPAAFAVTRERPGGVVVTDVSGLILIGETGGS